MRIYLMTTIVCRSSISLKEEYSTEMLHSESHHYRVVESIQKCRYTAIKFGATKLSFRLNANIFFNYFVGFFSI